MSEDVGERFQNIHLSAKKSGGVELEDGDVRISAEECRRRLKIGRLFQKVRNVIVVKGGGTKGSFLRLLVSHDVKEPLPRCTVIKLGSRQYNVNFQYEKLVSLCYYCGLVGHLERDCKTRLAHIEKGQVQEGQFGDWMKAADLGRGFGSPSTSYPSPRSNSQSNFTNPGDPSNSDIHQGQERDRVQAALKVALIPVTSSAVGRKMMKIIVLAFQ
ncbi:Unknown protein [Striga hermonthica]|uniref:CCHC-type domain-containing protein n=1 Tax=Striga hermonthica TaxID=68872 RepID=A0A9N7MGY5_STRHE|nr:Unknown protein [Striga hermonthica]